MHISGKAGIGSANSSITHLPLRVAPTSFLPILGRACRQPDRESVLERKGKAEDSRVTQEEESLSQML